MFCYQKNFSTPTLPVDEAQFYALVRATLWNENIDKYRETHNAALKRKLPAFIFQATFDETLSKKGKTGRWRKQAATRLTGLAVMDVDHLAAPGGPEEAGEGVRRIWEEACGRLGDEDRGRILLAYVTPSGHGLKIVFKARTEWGNLIDNQHQMAKRMGLEVDESCKDASRMSFICKESDILYIDNELFTYENKAYAEQYDEEYRAGHSAPLAPPAEAAAGEHAVPVAAQTEDAAEGDAARTEGGEEASWHGHSVQAIIDARYADKLPSKADSNRHAESLKLATDLLLMLDGDRPAVQRIVEAQPWVKEIMDERGENVGQTVQSAAECIAQKERKYGGDVKLSKAMQEAIRRAGCQGLPVPAPSAEENEGMGTALSDWGAAIEALTPEFPVMKDICKGLKRSQYPAALVVSGGLLMTLMTRCTYRFYHRPEELRRLNCSVLVIGDPASGKSFATRLFKLLAAPIVAADKAGKAAINAYREMMKTKGANKEKPKKPKVVVRVHPARTSNAQFIQDMVNAVEEVDGEQMQLHMLTFDTELDNTVTVQKGGSWIDKFSMELKAFHNEEDGQAYSNVDSILQDFIVTWNFIYTGTPIALKKKVNEHNFGSGLATRLTVIPLPATNFEMMERENRIDYQSDERLRTWAARLDKVKGLLPMGKIVDELYDWTARRMEDAKENNSKADEMLLKRCAYHGLNFAAPFIVMRHWDQLRQDGDYWCGEFETDEVDWRLAELITNMQYACQRHYFGTMAEAYFDNKLRDASVNVQRRPKTLEAFARLPEEFTIEDVTRCFNLSSDAAARKKVTRLCKDSLIEKISDSRQSGAGKTTFRKTGRQML